MADPVKETIVEFVDPKHSGKKQPERKSETKTLLLSIVTIGLVLAIAGLVLGLSFGLREDTETRTVLVGIQQSRCMIGNEFRNFSVASDTSICSEIGCHILEKKGSAVDAAIAGMFCITVVTMHSAGIGGGNFMLVYEKQKRKSTFINAREKAPAAAHERMFVKNKVAAKLGPLSAGVPGEVKGFIKAHQKFGKLKWAELVEPSVKLASEGFIVTPAVEQAIQKSKEKIKDPDFRKLLMNENGQFKKAGDTIVNPRLAETLRVIQEDPESFYTGELAKRIAADFENNHGIITEQDLKNYTVGVVEDKDVLKLDLGDVTMYSCPLPSGGPVVTQILNILQNYKFNRESIADIDSTILTYHRIVEAFKFAYVRRSYFGDPDFVQDSKLEEVLKEVLNVTMNRELYKKIWDNTTHNASYYGRYDFVEDKGSTSHLSVLAPNGDAVAVTGSINYYFGGKFRSNDTGILYNNEMDDFSTPGLTNFFRFKPTKNNFIRPGKRPLSSMSPTIFTDKKTGDVRLAVGAAGGSRIISSTAWVSILNLWMGLPIRDAVNAPRLHHQLLPNKIFLSGATRFRPNDEIIKGLEKKGHIFSNSSGKSVVQAVGYNPRKKTVFAASDPRKGGSHPWGL